MKIIGTGIFCSYALFHVSTAKFMKNSAAVLRGVGCTDKLLSNRLSFFIIVSGPYLSYRDSEQYVT